MVAIVGFTYLDNWVFRGPHATIRKRPTLFYVLCREKNQIKQPLRVGQKRKLVIKNRCVDGI